MKKDEPSMDIRNHGDSIEKLKERIHLLEGIRTVNKLIIKEKNINKLLDRICLNLIESSCFDRAWITLIRNGQPVEPFYHAGFKDGFDTMATCLKAKERAHCASDALAHSHVQIVEKPREHCRACPFFQDSPENLIFTARFEQEGKNYGWISLSCPPPYCGDGEIRRFIGDAADDIAFALWIREREILLREAQRTAHIAHWTYNPESGMIWWSEELYEIYGRDPADGPLSYTEHAKLIHPDDWKGYDEMMRISAEKGTSFDIFLRIMRPDGSWRTLNSICKPITDKSGGIVEMRGTIQDVTKLKSVEEELRASEGRARFLSDLIMNSDQPFAMGYGDGRLGRFNNAFCELTGYSAEELASMNWLVDLTPPKWRDIEIAAIEEMYRTGRPARYEKEYIRKDGRIIPIELLAHNHKNEQGEDDYYYAFITDISERKKTEEALRESERRLRILIGNLPGIAYRCVNDLRWPMEFISEGCLDITGYTSEELTRNETLFFGDLIHPEDSQMVWEGIQKAVVKNEAYVLEYRITDRAGNERWLWEQGRFVGIGEEGSSIMEGFISEITPSKMAEKEKERLFNDMEKRTKELTCLFSVSESIRKMAGMNQVMEDIVQIIPRGWQFPENTCCRIRFEEALFLSHPFRESQKLLTAEIRAEGKILGSMEVFYTGVPLEDDRDPFLMEERRLLKAISSMLGEASEHKRATDERQMLAQAIDQAAESVVITDVNGAIQYVNPAFEVNTGYARDEVIGLNSRILKSGKQDDSFYREMWDTLMRKESWSGRLVNRKKDGAFFTEDALISPVLDHTGRIVNFVGVKHNLTTELILEAQLRQAQKMEAVGRLAGGVAHDFNNMLGIILGLSDMILDQIDHNHPLYDDINEINNAGRRSSELTRQLLTFARKQIVVPRSVDLNQTVSGMIKMLKRLIGENIDLTWHPGESLWTILMDPGQIDQILANLCVNARDAIKDTGAVVIETENAILDETYCETKQDFRPGEYVRISLSDDGCGMNPETQENIFEPFFTTKGIGKGTGLGLAMVYGAVKQNNGLISVKSEVGKGTTIDLFLPRYGEEPAKGFQSREKEQSAPGHGTVLLVEDERAFLVLVKRMLESEGYNVITAGSPADAIGLVGGYEGTIDLLLTDLIMPGMNGRELAREISIRNPELKLLFMSGYSSSFIENRNILEEGLNFIQKPFPRTLLARKILEILAHDRVSPEDPPKGGSQKP